MLVMVRDDGALERVLHEEQRTDLQYYTEYGISSLQPDWSPSIIYAEVEIPDFEA